MRIAFGMLLLLAQSIRADETLELGAKDNPPIIASNINTPLVNVAKEKLTSFLQSLCGRAPDQIAKADLRRSSIIVGGPEPDFDHKISILDSSREESFNVSAMVIDSKPLVMIRGQSDAGVKRGVYWVMQHLSLDNGKLVLTNRSVSSTPFIKLRVTHVGGAMHQAFDPQTGKRFAPAKESTPEQLDWNMIARWTPQRLVDYADMLDFFGYNGIEAPPTFYVPAQTDETSVARRKSLRQRIERNRMIGVAKIDGTLSNAAAVPYGTDTKSQYDEYYKSMAQTAGPFNDILLTHWVDGGGWKNADADHPCTIDLLQDLHNQLAGEFKRVNPKCTSILSLWNLQNPDYQRWLGYKDVSTILDSGKIAKEVAIAESKIYRPDEAKKIVDSGHPLAVWGWYLADHELVYTMHVHTHVLADNISKLPPEARDTLWFYCLDNCQRETNIYSMYIGAKMLWNPQGDPDGYLREIARLVYGPKLEEPTFRALKAIADIRCGTQCRGYWNPRADKTNGVVSFDEACKQSMDAWNGIKDCAIDDSYLAPIKFHSTPQTLLAELKGQTQAVATYMQFLKDNQTEVPKAAGPFEYYERFQYLQKRAAQ